MDVTMRQEEAAIVSLDREKHEAIVLVEALHLRILRIGDNRQRGNLPRRSERPRQCIEQASPTTRNAREVRSQTKAAQSAKALHILIEE